MFVFVKLNNIIKSMRILYLLLVILIAQTAYALDIVYPKQNSVTINSPSTFFAGSAETGVPLTINGAPVPVHESGGFAYAVKLKTGENKFVIESGNEKQIFNIKRPKSSAGFSASSKPEIFYEGSRVFTTIKDNVPLRSSANDGGINRIAHYQEGIPLIVTGEKNGFYKVRLSDSKSAWVAIKDVSPSDEITPAHLLKRENVADKELYVFKIEFDKKIPYVIEDGHPFIVKFYNVEGKPESTFTFKFPLKQKLFGYSGKFEENTFVLKIRKAPQCKKEKPLKNIRIAVDAGHGGDETGAVGCLRNKEKDVNLEIAKKLVNELKSRGAKVITIRNGDETIGLNERIEIANQNNAAIFISIHANALPDHMDPNENKGTSVFYYYPQAKPLADKILKSMVSQLPFEDDGVRQASFAVVRNTEALSVLIETGYLINPSDNANLIDEEVQEQTAKAIADGIENFFKE